MVRRNAVKSLFIVTTVFDILALNTICWFMELYISKLILWFSFIVSKLMTIYYIGGTYVTKMLFFGVLLSSFYSILLSLAAILDMMNIGKHTKNYPYWYKFTYYFSAVGIFFKLWFLFELIKITRSHTSPNNSENRNRFFLSRGLLINRFFVA